jgi:hypothetical protein
MAIFQDMVKCPDSNGAYQDSSVLWSGHPPHDCRWKDFFFLPIRVFVCRWHHRHQASVCAFSNDRVSTAFLAACRRKNEALEIVNSSLKADKGWNLSYPSIYSYWKRFSFPWILICLLALIAIDRIPTLVWEAFQFSLSLVSLNCHEKNSKSVYLVLNRWPTLCLGTIPSHS